MIRRDQVVNRLREARYKYQSLADRTELYRQQGTGRRVNLSRRDLLDEDYVAIVLRQAGLTDREIESFFKDAVKE